MGTGLRTDTLWDVDDAERHNVWVACCTRPGPGHARLVSLAGYDDGELPLCPVCREPQMPMSKTAIDRYRKTDRRCEGCRLGDCFRCTGVGCYGCPPEVHAEGRRRHL